MRWRGIRQSFRLGTILGPSLGGLIYAFSRGPAAVYAASLASYLVAIFCTTLIKLKAQPRARDITLKTVLAGIAYIRRQKVVLGSISLDLFAMLLGGAVALLPAYASDILHTGPWGLGLLRSAPGVGAGAMAILLAYRPLRRRVGATMLWCVAAFGVFTIVFGLSRNLVLSLCALALVGASDMVSVVIRATLVQVATPDEMRGRVNAVDMIFIGASNELGQVRIGADGAMVRHGAVGGARRDRNVGGDGSVGVVVSRFEASRPSDCGRARGGLELELCRRRDC